MKTTTCFLIDDDPEEHFIFSMALEETGLNIHCEYFFDCGNALAYLATGAGQTPRFVFVDANMPGVPLEDCLSDLSKLLSFCDAEIVIYTGFIPAETSGLLDQWGAWRQLPKNSSISGLASELNRLFT